MKKEFDPEKFNDVKYSLKNSYTKPKLDDGELIQVLFNDLRWALRTIDILLDEFDNHPLNKKLPVEIA